MKKILNVSTVIALVFFLSACGNSSSKAKTSKESDKMSTEITSSVSSKSSTESISSNSDKISQSVSNVSSEPIKETSENLAEEDEDEKINSTASEFIPSPSSEEEINIEDYTNEMLESNYPGQYAEAVEFARRLQKPNDQALISQMTKSLIQIGLPFYDNDWPEVYISPDGIRTIGMGTPAYDIDMETNFSGDCPNNKYARAKDNKMLRRNLPPTSSVEEGEQ